jgi:tungstate transport system permease protein
LEPVPFGPELWPIVGLSLGVSVTAVVLSTLLGVPLGTWLGLTRSRLRSSLAAITYTGMGLPPVVVGLAVYLLLSRSGPLARLELEWLFTSKAMVLAQVILVVPYVTGITMAAVASVPAETFAQVRSLGATAWQARWAILREARPGVVLAIAAGFGRSISEVGAVYMVGGDIPGQTRVLTTAIMLETNKGNFALALALGGWLLALALAANLLILRLQGRPVS